VFCNTLLPFGTAFLSAIGRTAYEDTRNQARGIDLGQLQKSALRMQELIGAILSRFVTLGEAH
jgi:hypothetical protein